MIARLILCLFLLAAPVSAQQVDQYPSGLAPDPAETVVAGLSRDDVDITTNFDGSEIIIYGAIKRETPIPPGRPLDLIVVVEGPTRAVTVRHKERKLGIWVNTGGVRIGAAPTFYAIASTRPLPEVITPAQDQRHRVSIPYAMRSFAGPIEVEDTVPYTEALIRLRQQDGLYRADEGSILLAEQTLFRADFSLPANLTEGYYSTRIFLLRDGEVLDTVRAPIHVRKVGLERWLYRLAFDQPLVYGLLSLAIAVVAGWGASTVFRMIQRP